MTLDRRDFIGLQAAMAGMFVLPGVAGAGTIYGQETGLEWLRHQSPPQSIPTRSLKLAGQLPTGVRGDLFKTGPAIPGGFDRSPAHFFDGDGFVQNYHFGDDGITFSGRFVFTAKFRAEQAHGDLFIPSFSTVWPDSPSGLLSDDMNPANTSVRLIGDRLMALWEAGSPHEIDPETLETKGAMVFGEAYRHAPFSAHPRRDPAGGWWNFGQVFWKDQLLVYRLDDAGKMLSQAVIDSVQPGMIHDFAVTERFLIFMIPPFVWQDSLMNGRASFLDSHLWRPELGTNIIVIDKQDLSVVRRHQIDAAFQFHFANAFDDSNGDIHIDFCRYENPDVLHTFLRMGAAHDRLDSFARPYLTRLRLRRSGTSHELTPLASMPMEFPRLPDDLQGSHRHLCLTLGIDDASGFSRFIALSDLQTGRQHTFDLGVQCHADEHMFVRSEDGSHQWIIGTHANLAERLTYLNVFQVDDLENGPIARAVMPIMLPPALHGDFIAG